MKSYSLGIDQSTQGTKAILFDEEGHIVEKAYLAHRQIIDDRGYVEHDLNEIYDNTIKVVKMLIEKRTVDKSLIKVVGISNQRETAAMWDKTLGHPIYNAVVWQCARGEKICEDIEKKGLAEIIRKKTGLRLSPYFSAAKFSWLYQNVDIVREKSKDGTLAMGNIDSYLVYRLTSGKVFRTDYSNASRTQLFNIVEKCWDKELCDIFGVNIDCLPTVSDSNADFGETDFEGLLDHKIKIRAVMGDSHAALYGQGCHKMGLTKVTYGTGSSIMMNIGDKPIFSDRGIVTSIGYAFNGNIKYVLEGNINYTGATISWLKDNLKMINSASETEEIIKTANVNDTTYLVPAFSGLGAPHFMQCKAMLCGMTRTTGRAEIVRAAVESIAYQIADVVKAMEQSIDIKLEEIRVDGGPTKNKFLMQFQSDLLKIKVHTTEIEELSAMGVALMAGITDGIYDDTIFSSIKRTVYDYDSENKLIDKKYEGWLDAINMLKK